MAPEPFFADRLARADLHYLSADVVPGAAQVVMDITRIDRDDGSFDAVYAGHVLEHVADDLQALRELRRVVTPDGWVLLQVPMWEDTTREDASITDPDERTRLFGQPDHVRAYGRDGVFEDRLAAAGFDVTVVDPAMLVPEADRRRHRLRAGEPFHLCRPRSPRPGEHRPGPR